MADKPSNQYPDEHSSSEAASSLRAQRCLDLALSITGAGLLGLGFYHGFADSGWLLTAGNLLFGTACMASGLSQIWGRQRHRL